MASSAKKIITGIRISVPYVMATLAPLVMAPKYPATYARSWENVPKVTRGLMGYGLFLERNLWFAILIALAVAGCGQWLTHHKKLSQTVTHAFPALHLTGVLLAMLVICGLFLPSFVSLVE